MKIVIELDDSVSVDEAKDMALYLEELPSVNKATPIYGCGSNQNCHSGGCVSPTGQKEKE